MAKIIDLDIVIPIIFEPVRPNTMTIPTTEIISVGTSSIEVSQSFQCDVDYVGGVVCDTDQYSEDATMVKNPNTISKIFTGLTSDTDYYLRGIGLPVLGNFAYGETVAVHTAPNPIPDEYQLANQGSGEFIVGPDKEWDE